jgi:hypothetical protein
MMKAMRRRRRKKKKKKKKRRRGKMKRKKRIDNILWMRYLSMASFSSHRNSSNFRVS